MHGGSITLDSPLSSQYISALLLVAPLFEEGLSLRWTGVRLSEPYVRMTVECLRHFGVPVQESGEGIHVPHTLPKVAPLVVPVDFSAAAFWFETVALAQDAEVYLTGLRADGQQGDQAIVPLLRDHVHATAEGSGMTLRSIRSSEGAGTAVLDLSATPDLFQPLAFTFAALGRPISFSGLHNLPLKETDRLAAVASALRMFGVSSHQGNGTFTLIGNAGLLPTDHAFDTLGDHRMAMALAPLALVVDAISLNDADVVSKSYPTFWSDLERAGFRLDR